MASIPGGQYAFFAGGQALNVVTTPDGMNLPPPVPGKFNLELVTSLSGPSGIPAGYQGVAFESADGKTIDLGAGNYGVRAVGSGAQTIIAGTGNDTIYGGSGDDVIHGGTGVDMLYGDAGNDTIYGGTGPETIRGGDGDDRIYGGSGPGELYGGNGHDTMFGGAGPDTIYAGSGNDLIYGGSGSDTIDGGSGNNTIYGGSGADLISESGAGGHDTVFGFSHAGGDAISFAGENSQTTQQVVATAQESHGNTTITLPDGSTMTLVGITHIDQTFFH
jgi:Ca2+-binding RTX toxin-like protein